MKKLLSLLTLSLVLTLVFSFGFSNSAYAKSPGKVVVSGHGEINLAPNTASISIGVETTADTLSQADEENKEKIKKVHQILKNHNIEDKNIKTQNFYAHQKYDYLENKPKLVGYCVSNHVLINTTDLQNISQLVSDLISDGTNIFNGVTFGVLNSEQAYQDALSLAYENAKSKATTLLGKNDLTATEIIEESFSTIRNFKNLFAAESDSSSIFGGEIIIRASVKVVFETNEINIKDSEKSSSENPKIENNKIENKTNEPNPDETKPNEIKPNEIKENLPSASQQTPPPILVEEPQFLIEEPKQITNEDANKEQKVNQNETEQTKPNEINSKIRPRRLPKQITNQEDENNIKFFNFY